MEEIVRTVTLKLPEDLDQALTELAGLLDTSRSAVIREAIVAFMRDRGATVGALARDLAGSLDGPGDLSTSAEHMAGYGE